MATDLIVQPDGSRRPMDCAWRYALIGEGPRCHNPMFARPYPQGHEYTSCRWCEPSEPLDRPESGQ